jgi:hypothetical protein
MKMSITEKLGEMVVRLIVAAVGIGVIFLAAVLPGPGLIKAIIAGIGIALVLLAFPDLW